MVIILSLQVLLHTSDDHYLTVLCPLQCHVVILICKRLFMLNKCKYIFCSRIVTCYKVQKQCLWKELLTSTCGQVLLRRKSSSETILIVSKLQFCIFKNEQYFWFVKWYNVSSSLVPTITLSCCHLFSQCLSSAVFIGPKYSFKLRTHCK